MASPSSAGILHVTMHPRDASASPDFITSFHDWYNNEHGPLRLRLPFFANGYRYRAADSQTPEWMAVYDVQRMDELQSETYTRLRQEPVQSQRERDVMKGLNVDRRFWDLAATVVRDASAVQKPARSLLVSYATLDGNAGSAVEQLSAAQQQFAQATTSWQRTRLFVKSRIEDGRSKPGEAIFFHDFDGSESIFPDSVVPILADIGVTPTVTRQYNLYYDFGPAPRDRESPIANINFTDNKTRTVTNQLGGNTALESYITTRDSALVHYRLEGSIKRGAPTLVLVNSILTRWGIWDKFLSAFNAAGGSEYQILRVNPRGITHEVGNAPTSVTVDVLADDIAQLLAFLHIPSVASVIGVSLGGATALNFALRHPQLTRSFIACDTNPMAPASNAQAWEERIALAQSDNASAQTADGSSVPVVGETLAEKTTRRWFTEASYADATISQDIARVKDMVRTNALDGFRSTARALYAYDMREAMKTATTRGLFVVGSADGILPKSMQAMAEAYGDGTSELKIVDGAGHLPMVDRPVELARVVAEFLETAPQRAHGAVSW